MRNAGNALSLRCQRNASSRLRSSRTVWRLVSIVGLAQSIAGVPRRRLWLLPPRHVIAVTASGTNEALAAGNVKFLARESFLHLHLCRFRTLPLVVRS